MSRPEDGQPNHAILGSGRERDAWSDNARDGSKIVRKEDCSFEMDFSATTIEEEYFDGGWNRIQRPVPARPDEVSNSGMRGEPGTDADTPGRSVLHPVMPDWDNDGD